MEGKEALNILENLCLTVMVQIPRESRDKVLEAGKVLNEIVSKYVPEKENKKEGQGKT